jgi:hypothetical protein
VGNSTRAPSMLLTGKEAIRVSIPIIEQIIAKMAKERDEWDGFAEGGGGNK